MRQAIVTVAILLAVLAARGWTQGLAPSRAAAAPGLAADGGGSPWFDVASLAEQEHTAGPASPGDAPTTQPAAGVPTAATQASVSSQAGPSNERHERARQEFLAALGRLEAMELAPSPAVTLPAAQAGDAQSPAPPKSAEPRRELDPQILQALSGMAPEDVRNPRMLADALYLAGHRSSALRFYEIALQSPSLGDEADWLLFQAGNCLYRQDAAAAMGYYRRLIDSHAGSALASVAEAKLEVLQWMEANKPRRLLDDPALRPAGGQEASGR